jgi:hypothetical protein
MKIIFHLKGNLKQPWEPNPEQPFHFQLMVTTLRATGYFLSDGLYINGSEIVAIKVEPDTY